MNYLEMHRKLEVVRKEIRQNVLHLKIIDDHNAFIEKLLWFGSIDLFPDK